MKHVFRLPVPGRAAIAVALLTSILGWGCTGSEVGNPSVALTAWTTDEDTASAGEPRGGVGIDAAWISVEDVQFVPVDHARGPVVVPAARPLSLVGGSATLEFEPSEGAYGEVRLHLTPAPENPEGAPAELAGNTFMITGRRSDGTAFRIAGPSPRAFSLFPHAGTAIHVDEPRHFILAFDLAAWFGPILEALDGLAAPAEGPLVVDADRHAEVLDTFVDGFASAASLHADDNGNGALDREESSPIAQPMP